MGRGFYYCTTIFNWVLLLIADALPFASLWPFERPISGFPFWGLAVIDGSTAFALPADLLSAAAERRQRAPRGYAPGPRRTAKGLRPGVCNSNPPPCLSRAVRSTILSAERFLARPLGMGSGGGGCADNLVSCFHLTPTGRFRPPLSWPYSVFPPAGGNEPFGLVACGPGRDRNEVLL